MEGRTGEVGFQQELLQLLREQKETMEKVREEQNLRMENIAESIWALQKSSNDELLDLVRKQNGKMDEQNELIERQNENMKEALSAIKTLEKNSNFDHDEEPFSAHELERHEPGWRAAFETLMMKMKDQVERWRNGMDSTLIFVALFVTVITAFQTPVSQNLSPNPADVTNRVLNNLTAMVFEIAMLNGLKVPLGLSQPEPFRPDRIDQVLTLLWYSALLMSLITAILSVFGRQWVERLMKKPDGTSYRDRSWRLDYRLKLAEKLLRPILDSLHPILILSIILFIVGLLLQLWSISFSLGKPGVLIWACSLGSALILGTVTVTMYTFVHGVWWEESPFTTSTSLGIRQQLHWLVKPVPRFTNHYSLFCSAVMQMNEIHYFEQVSSVPFRSLLFTSDICSIELAVNTIVSVLESDASLKAKQTIAWHLCHCHWYIEDAASRKNSVGYHRRLHDALRLAYDDTPSTQEKIGLTFFVARMAVLLRFSGVAVDVPNLENRQVKEICTKIFKLHPKQCIDEIILIEAKYWACASKHCIALGREEPSLFDDINEDEELLTAIVRDEPFSLWKPFILKHYNQGSVTNILDIISKGSPTKESDCLHSIKSLSLVLDSCQLPLVFPSNFDISALIQYTTSNEHRFDRTFISWPSAVDVILSYLFLMDDTLLSRQHHLLCFLDSLDEIEVERPQIRDGILNVNIKALRNRVALSVLPIGLVTDEDSNDACST